MKKPMTLERALELVIGYATTQYNPPTVGNSDELRQAADILSNMAEEPVKKTLRNFGSKCNTCGNIMNSHPGWEPCNNCNSWGQTRVSIKKTYRTARTLQIVDVEEDDVKFEEVD